jgi:hypothetical protein
VPQIEELFLTHSVLYDLPAYELSSGGLSAIRGFASLRKLDVSNCEISDWTQILSFGCLPTLTELLADENPISRVLPCPDRFFLTLTRFSLSMIPLTDWSDVDSFNTYPALQNLRLTDSPFLLSKGISESRSIVIARVSQITFLNGSPVSEKERANAENTYVRRCLRDHDANPDAAVESIVSSGLHPRFVELHRKFAADLVVLGRTKVSNTIQSDLVEVTFKNLSFISNGSLEPIAKKLPSTLQVVRLRQLVKQLFGLDPVLQQLSFRLYKDAPPTLMEDEDLTLAQYGVISGAEIFINEAKAST